MVEAGGNTGWMGFDRIIMPSRTWKVKIIDGEIIHLNKVGFQRLIKKLEGKACDLTIEERQSPKADSIRRHYFGFVIKPLMDYTGHDKDSLHEFFKMEFASEIDEHGLKITRSVFSHNSTMTDNEKIEFIFSVFQRIKLINEEIDVRPYGV